MEKHELEKVSWGVIPITVYRGCLVTKLVGGYEIWGNRVLKPQDVDELIDKAGSILSESIDRGGQTVREGFSCQNIAENDLELGLSPEKPLEAQSSKTINN